MSELQKVQVAYKPGGRGYTYEVPEGMSLFPGDLVSVPVGADEHAKSAQVLELGSEYTGPCKQVTEILRESGPLQQRLEDLKEMTGVQCSDGNWNYSSYMHGMANGMIYALHLMRGADGTPEYIEVPEGHTWLVDIPVPENMPEAVPASVESDPED